MASCVFHTVQDKPEIGLCSGSGVLTPPCLNDVKVSLCTFEYPTKAAKPPKPIASIQISTLHSFEYTKDGIVARKIYGIGAGKYVSFSDLPTLVDRCVTMNVVFKFGAEPIGKPAVLTPGYELSRNDSVYCCPQPTCFRQFRSTARLLEHVANGEHDTLTPETAYDGVKRIWHGLQGNVQANTVYRDIEWSQFLPKSSNLSRFS